MKKIIAIVITCLTLSAILIAGLTYKQTVLASQQSDPTVANQSAKPKHHYLLVMGHGAGDPGAHGNGTTEAHFLRAKFLPKLRKYAKEVKNSRVTFYNPKHDIVRDTLVFHKGSYKINKKTTVIMFHLDAGGGTYAHGGHVIIHRPIPTKRDRRLAHVIKKYVGLNPAYHGYSYRTNLRNCNVLRRRGIDYSLVEMGFITNKHDFKKINQHLDQIAKNDIEAITHETIK
ncbi:N-acetylmuramoyl-L-alanine amidase [Lentilactobacillus diolivorans]|uniref:N-acetylmuramoyl-L-alanine amidase n=1 Tax=Lentilactobacillus diolivorans TaxID=179838 RepID=UPI0024692072|nr:N-acetylmuramoyl-L-alanine amidase [Lentilactobacillus diolivorans]MDH5105771.1 N-acetylmuramoyl-L-alanine amidase [Lentilactobacillus diolivorans]